MSLILVQLSDIHFKSPGSNTLLERVDKIASAIVSVDKNAKLCLLLITGDIAFSGKAAEYDIAFSFFKELHSKLLSGMPNTNTRFVFIPGNHDCDFSIINNVRDIVLPTISVDQNVPQDVIEQMISVQANYFEFVEKWNDETITQVTNKLYGIIRMPLDKDYIEFHVINSAWMSTKNEQQGKLLFPQGLISSIPNEEAPALVVSLLHHPYQWFNANNSRALRNSIEFYF